jgi:GNAT superfamily N-acetyltransferase
MKGAVVTANDFEQAFSFRPLTPERWPDFEQLFGPRGAVGGCWCMWWRQSSGDHDRNKGEANRRALKEVVESGEVPGILAYWDGLPVGWCSFAPRERYPRLNRSRTLKAIDETPVWSIGCFFIPRQHQAQGLSAALLRAAVAYIATQGGRVVEGYPIEPKEAKMPAVFAWTGFASTYKAAGFVECARRSESRPIMRYFISGETVTGTP